MFRSLQMLASPGPRDGRGTSIEPQVIAGRRRCPVGATSHRHRGENRSKLPTWATHFPLP